MSALRMLRAGSGMDERDAARVRFVADVEVAAAHATWRRRDDIGWLAARAFALDATDADWLRLRRAVARLLDDDLRRPDPACDRLRGFVTENDDLP